MYIFLDVCNNFGVLSIILLFKYLLGIMVVVAATLLIIMVSLDLTKNVISGSDKVIINNNILIMNRVSALTFLFFVPLICHLLLGIIDEATTQNNKDTFLNCYERATIDNIKYYKSREKAIKDQENYIINNKREEKKREREKIKKIKEERRKRQAERIKEEEENRNNNGDDGEIDNSLPSGGRSFIIYYDDNGKLNKYCSKEGPNCHKRIVNFDANNVTKITNLNTDEVAFLIKSYGGNSSNMAPFSSGYVKVERKYKINLFFLISLQATESGWYTSNIARNCNNLGGVCYVKGTINCGECNSNCCFQRFNTVADFQDKQARLLRNSYLNKNGPYYEGVSIKAINKHYCPINAGDPNCATWYKLMANMGNQFFNMARKNFT